MYSKTIKNKTLTRGHTTINTGFTLIEILFAVIFFSLIVGGVTALSVYYFRSYAFSFSEHQVISLAQSSLTRMLRDMRETRTAENGAWPISEALDTSLTFYSDVTNDRRVDRVRYFLDGTSLKRGVIEPTTTIPISYPTTEEKITILATAVDPTLVPLFTYYNGDWPIDTINNPLPAENRIYNTRYITIHLRVHQSEGANTQSTELKSGVHLRSLKDND